jgi:hypothetical protein
MQSNRRQWMAGAAAAAMGGAVPGLSWASSADLDRLEAMVEGAEAVRAVKRLQHSMALYALTGRWRDLAGLFASDATAELGVVKLAGRKAIADYFTQAVGEGREGVPPGKLYAPLVLSPVVTLDDGGALARGRWREVAMLGEYGRSARWAGGIWENTYAREGGVWKIRSLGYGPRFAGAYEGGWRSTAGSSKVVTYHYDARRAGIPVPELTEPFKRSAGSPAARLDRLQWRIRLMEDEAAIQNLQHAYGYYLDRKMWDDVADLFADQGTMELGQEGVYVGKASIRRGLERFGAAGLHENELNDHAQLQTVVTSFGTVGMAEGVELSMTGYNGRHAEWSLGIFDNDYVKQDGVWAIRTAHVYARLISDYAKGWATNAEPTPTANKAYPPDRPPTLSYQAYPAAFRPPSHSQDRVIAPIDLEPPATASELQRRLDGVIARDGAENVSNAYGYYIDEFQWDSTADLFAVDGAKELSYIGLYVGRERVRKSLKLRYGPGGRTSSNMTLHQKTQPVTHVTADGRSARTRTRLFQMNSQPDRPGSYIAGIYENQLVREDGVWRIKFMDLDYTWTASYADGWGKVRGGEATQFAPRELPAAFKAFPPDQPLRGVTVAPYPGVAEMAFHYPNPVSGRPPPGG